MEVRCPQCEQRLRYSNVLKNPLLRCRSCGTTFRVADVEEVLQPTPVEMPAYEPRETADPFNQIPPLQTKQDEPRSDNSRGYAKSGIGTVGIVVMLIALKIGIRLVREFTRDRPAQPPGRKMQVDQERMPGFEKLIRELGDAKPNGLLER